MTCVTHKERVIDTERSMIPHRKKGPHTYMRSNGRCKNPIVQTVTYG